MLGYREPYQRLKSGVWSSRLCLCSVVQVEAGRGTSPLLRKAKASLGDSLVQEGFVAKKPQK